MLKDVYDPLNEYVNVFHKRFKDVAETTFAELVNDAQIDIETNRDTCRQIYATESNLSSAKSRIVWWIVWCVLLWICVIIGVTIIVINFEGYSAQLISSIAIADIIILLYLILKVHPRLKQLKIEKNNLAETLTKLKNEAWQQMSPLNRLYDWDVLTRMMTRTVPRLEFDPYFTTQRLADLKITYGWDDAFNTDRSVIYSHSGLINGNPLIICRTRKMDMGSKTYYGHKTIHWTRREQDADGKYHTVHHSQTLTASVTAPYPEYFEKTRLIYGNTAAPDLIFYRKQSGLAGNDNSLSFKWKKRSLRKKSRDLSNADFAMMTNEEFEIAFNTSNRNNNQQYALLFTPLAQESMLNLLKDNKVGFGDNFDFEKNKMINTVVSNHMQNLDLDMNPEQYRHFDYDKAKVDFYEINARYFRAIYFSLAPLLCVPLYQQIRPYSDIYGRDMAQHSAFWEHEALANFWGQDHFKHPQCVTDCILKTQQQKGRDDNSTITVYAHGYRTERRLAYISQWGGDGCSHRVPVYWDEYLSVVGTGSIQMREDNTDLDDTKITHKQRFLHINNLLKDSNLDIYRKHIASRI